MTYGNIEFHPGPGFNVILGILRAGAKIHIISKNQHIENANFYKIHLSEISFFTKFTYLKSQFSQDSHF